MRSKPGSPVIGVIDPIGYWNVAQFEHANTVQAGDIKRELIWFRSSLVMRVDATRRAEVVFSRSGVELIKTQFAGAFRNNEVVQLDGRDNGTPTAAHSAIATVQVLQPLSQGNFKLYCPAVTRAPMLGLNFDVGTLRRSVEMLPSPTKTNS